MKLEDRVRRLLERGFEAYVGFGRWLNALAGEHPSEFLIAVVLLARLHGAKIESGWWGVLFRSGRVERVLEPGFYPLIPWVWRVKKIRSRSQTLDSRRQRVTGLDGLVYEVDANVVFRVVDPIKALVEIKDLREGVDLALSLAVREVLGAVPDLRHAAVEQAATAVEGAPETDLDGSLAGAMQRRLARWGAEVESAAFTSIAPSAQTLRLTQLSEKVEERHRAFRVFRAAGLEAGHAAALLGAGRRLVSHSRRTYSEARSREERGRRFEIRRGPGENVKPEAEAEPFEEPKKAKPAVAREARDGKRRPEEAP